MQTELKYEDNVNIDRRNEHVEKTMKKDAFARKSYKWTHLGRKKEDEEVNE